MEEGVVEELFESLFCAAAVAAAVAVPVLLESPWAGLAGAEVVVEGGHLPLLN